MGNSNEEQPSVPENVNISGIGFFVPFVEKLKLYQTYLRKKSVWNKNKQDYWKHEKALLHWAWSPAHQHLAAKLDKKRLEEIYKHHELQVKNKRELEKDMAKNYTKLLPVMDNLYLKGFADATADNDKCINSIIINARGLLMGSLIDEENRGQLWKYRVFLFTIYNLVALSVLVGVFTLRERFLGFLGSKEINMVYSEIPKWIAENTCGGWLITCGLLLCWVSLVWEKGCS